MPGIGRDRYGSEKKVNATTQSLYHDEIAGRILHLRSQPNRAKEHVERKARGAMRTPRGNESGKQGGRGEPVNSAPRKHQPRFARTGGEWWVGGGGERRGGRVPIPKESMDSPSGTAGRKAPPAKPQTRTTHQIDVPYRHSVPKFPHHSVPKFPFLKTSTRAVRRGLLRWDACFVATSVLSQRFVETSQGESAV